MCISERESSGRVTKWNEYHELFENAAEYSGSSGREPGISISLSLTAAEKVHVFAFSFYTVPL